MANPQDNTQALPLKDGWTPVSTAWVFKCESDKNIITAEAAIQRKETGKVVDIFPKTDTLPFPHLVMHSRPYLPDFWESRAKQRPQEVVKA